MKKTPVTMLLGFLLFVTFSERTIEDQRNFTQGDTELLH